jgi:hypothetical protein
MNARKALVGFAVLALVALAGAAVSVGCSSDNGSNPKPMTTPDSGAMDSAVKPTLDAGTGKDAPSSDAGMGMESGCASDASNCNSCIAPDADFFNACSPYAVHCTPFDNAKVPAAPKL